MPSVSLVWTLIKKAGTVETDLSNNLKFGDIIFKEVNKKMLLSVNDLQLYLIISPFIAMSKSNNQISFLDNKPGGNSLESTLNHFR